MALELQEKLYKTQKRLICCAKKVRALEGELLEQKELVSSANVTITCYNSHPSQTDGTPFVTAFNTKTGPGTVAVSRDLLDKGFTPLSKVWIEGFGVYTINDIMNKRYTNRVDIWIDQKAKAFKKKDVRIVSLCSCPNKCSKRERLKWQSDTILYTTGNPLM
jgi:3D (Asp-Asp-Asp) domain-containing protein